MEREYASRIGLKGLMKQSDESFDTFHNAVTHLFPNHYDSDLIKWAFAVSTTRAWITEMTTESGETVHVRSLVPLGDLFNHGAVGGLGVYPKQNSVASPVIMQIYNDESKVDDKTKEEEIFMDYGMSENPARFPVIYGFVDASAPTFPAMWVINAALERAGTEDGVAMGFDDFKLVAFDTETGSPSPFLWDAYLYNIHFDELRRSEGRPAPEEKLRQDLLQIVERSCREGNRSNAMQYLHLKCLPKMIEFLILDVGDIMNKLGPLPPDLADNKDYPHYNMIRSFHQYQLTVLKKVKRFLESEQEAI